MSSHTTAPALQSSCFYGGHSASYFSIGGPLSFPICLFFSVDNWVSIFLIPSLLSPESMHHFALWPKLPHLVHFSPTVSSSIGGTVSGPVSSISVGPACQPVPAQSNLIKSVLYIPSPLWSWGRSQPIFFLHLYEVLCSLSYFWSFSLCPSNPWIYELLGLCCVLSFPRSSHYF